MYCPDIHGLGFSAGGRRLFVPAHDGLRVYAGGEWRALQAPVHDYMGFAATGKGFYISGHPGLGSGYENPPGLAGLSADGTVLTPIAFAGQLDFHLLAVGYRNRALYLLNEEDHPSLPRGLHYSPDEGRSWRQIARRGVGG